MTIEHIHAEETPDRDPATGRFAEGRPFGRKPGPRNKATKAVKDALMEAFEEVGGVGWLVDLARSDPRTFAMLLGKLVPRESQVSSDDVPLVIVRDYTGGAAERGA